MLRKNPLRFLIVLSLLLFSASGFAQVKIIFDTDFGSDADDLGSLAMLHGFVANKEAELLAIMVWSIEESVIPAIDAVNRYYGHPDIPMGIRAGDSYTIKWNHNKAIADNLPHKLTNKDLPDATSLYRKILSENKDHSVVLVTVGPLMNIQKLLESKPDSYSKLTGKELLNRKVKEVVVMGGQYPEGKKEWNFWGNMPGVTKYVFDNISRPVVFSGYEVGEAIRTGAVFNSIPPQSPLYLGYKYFSEHASWMKENYEGKILNNATFDQTAVLYAVRGGLGKHWVKEEGGYNQIDAEGNNQWVKGKKTNQSYLRLIENPETMARLIEGLMLYDLKP